MRAEVGDQESRPPLGARPRSYEPIPEILSIEFNAGICDREAGLQREPEPPVARMAGRGSPALHLPL